jgi:hypothetical protein
MDHKKTEQEEQKFASEASKRKNFKFPVEFENDISVPQIQMSSPEQFIEVEKEEPPVTIDLKKQETKIKPLF